MFFQVCAMRKYGSCKEYFCLNNFFFIAHAMIRTVIVYKNTYQNPFLTISRRRLVKTILNCTTKKFKEQESLDKQEPAKSSVNPEWARHKSLSNGNGDARCVHNNVRPFEMTAASLTKLLAQIHEDIIYERITCLAQNDDNTSELKTKR